MEILDYQQLEDNPHVITEDEVMPKFVIFRRLARMYVAFIIGMGVVGNVACLILYRQPTFSRFRCSRYLTALAISDLTSLLCLGLLWLKAMGIRWQDSSDFVCTASVYVSNTATFLSAWYVMLLTADMAWALRRHYNMASFHDSKAILGRILAVAFLGLVANCWTWSAAKVIPDELHVFVRNDTVEGLEMALNQSSFDYVSDKIRELSQEAEKFYEVNGCQMTFNNNKQFAQSTIIYNMIVSFSIPLVVTLVLNAYMGNKILKSARQRRQISEQEQMIRLKNQARARRLAAVDGSDSAPLHEEIDEEMDIVVDPSIAQRRGSIRQSVFSCTGKEASVSSLLVAKSLTYLIFNLPTHVFRIWSMIHSPFESTDPLDSRDIEFFINLIVYVLFYTQFSLNFILYSGHVCRRRERD